MMIVRAYEERDAQAICDIYNYYIQSTIVTFEEVPLGVASMIARIAVITKNYPWLVCEDQGRIVGYAYASLWKERSAFRHTAEVTIYLENGQSGKGYGKALYQALFDAMEKTDCHVLIAGIALPNEASVAIHERYGFEKVAHFTEVGFKFQQWLDVGYWQKTLAYPEPE